jgi:hypothetical protein
MKDMAGRKHLTSRDIKLINFLEDTSLLITAPQAARMFYKSPTGNVQSSLTIARRRLTQACELKQLNRYRDHIDQNFVYYTGKKPKKIEHKLLITEFIINFNNDFEILEIHTEFKGLEKKYGIRPDIYIIFKFGNDILSTLVECDNTKGFTNGETYAQVVSDWKKGKLDNVLPYTLMIISCTDKKNDHSFKPIPVKTDFSNFSNIKYALIRAYDKRKK